MARQKQITAWADIGNKAAHGQWGEYDDTDARAMVPGDLDPLLALAPELLVLGTGADQAFPPAAVLAACLQRGIGIEVMTNAAAARTYSVLAGEGRRVAAGFIIG
jgi:uncharacterized protein